MNTIKIIILITIIYVCYVHLTEKIKIEIEKFKSYNINIVNDNCGINNRPINTPWNYYYPQSYYYPYSYVNPYNFMYPPTFY